MIDKFTILPVCSYICRGYRKNLQRQAVHSRFRLIGEQFNYVIKQAGFN